MGMGYGASADYVILKSDLEKICKEEMEILDSLFKDLSINWDDVARAYNYEDNIHPIYDDLGLDETEAKMKEQEVFDTLLELFKMFHQKTGLRLEIGYHNSEDEGGRYDDVDGAYFSVSGAYQLTPEAKALENQGIHIRTATWVTYG